LLSRLLPLIVVVGIIYALIYALWSDFRFLGSSTRRPLLSVLLFILGLILFVAFVVVFLLLPSPS